MTIFFDDFAVGDVRHYPGPTVTREAIIGFAREFDAQPMHVDETAAARTMAGGLIASGWHTAALHMRMLCDDFIRDAASMGAPGLEELKWLLPVRAGDTLSGRRTVLEVRPSGSRADRGFVRFRFEVLNQQGAVVMEQVNSIIFGRRGQWQPPAVPVGRQPVADPGSVHPAADSDAAAVNPSVTMAGRPYLEDLQPGEVVELGSYHFSAADIVRFAAAYDPQSFHLDDAAARESHFGRLTASGWQTAAAWMKLMVGLEPQIIANARAAGRRSALLGPSPGFKNMRWLKPVFAGDTIRYTSTLMGGRASRSRPGWGIVDHVNEGFNAAGEKVFHFDGCVFWQCRPA
jgi:acyl dehydratase